MIMASVMKELRDERFMLPFMVTVHLPLGMAL